jgi:hypothetical protein
VSWRRRIRAGEAAVTAHGGSGARCSALTSASGGLVTTRGEGPCRHFKAHVAKIILVRAGLWGHLSNNHLPSPNSDSFFFSLPRNLSSALGSMSPTTSSQILARKRRRGVSLFTLLPFLGLLLINGKPPPLHVSLEFTAVMERSAFVLPPSHRSLRSADETGSITVCLS